MDVPSSPELELSSCFASDEFNYVRVLFVPLDAMDIVCARSLVFRLRSRPPVMLQRPSVRAPSTSEKRPSVTRRLIMAITFQKKSRERKTGGFKITYMHTRQSINEIAAK